jgi:GNAT superfamily N-acetyltransferase
MSISAESPPRDGSPPVLRAVPYDDPVAQFLVEQVQLEYVQRYGGRDAAVVDPAEFRPPHGLFLVAEVDGEPAGCGAWRVHAPGAVEIKRVYVEPRFRRRGLARLLVESLERTAAEAGARAVVLNSGTRQPEALALYDLLGYRPIPGYGIYAQSRDGRFLGKDLLSAPADGAGESKEERPWES